VSESRRPSPGHAATLLVLLMLVLMTCAAVYVVVARIGQGPPTLGPLRDDPGDEAATMLRSQQLTVLLLTILLISALLLLLYVLGAYLLLRVGRIIARERLGGRPTKYVDAWGSYRLTPEQIARATAEEPPAGGAGPQAGGPPPGTPPA